jgi:hypothetical protein
VHIYIKNGILGYVIPIPLVLLKSFWVIARRQFLVYTNVSGTLLCPIFRVLDKKGCQEVRNVCLYRNGVQLVVLNGRANQEERGGVVCWDRF